jgi:hypothetical protein
MTNQIDEKMSSGNQSGTGLKAAVQLRMIDRKMKTIDQWCPLFSMLKPQIMAIGEPASDRNLCSNG